MTRKSVAETVHKARADLAGAEAALRKAISDLPDGPERGRLIQERWNIVQMIGRDRRFHSQAGQDEFLDRAIFKGRRNGTFVEIGAYDGITGSNTLFFEAHRGWSGLLIEASPSLHALAAERRLAPCLQVAVAAEAGQAEFLDVRKGYVQMGGLVETLGEAERKVIEADPRTQSEIIKVPTRALADILIEEGLRRIDYISIDIEGGEPGVLASFPFGDFDIHAWTIEVNDGSDEIVAIMAQASYARIAHIGVDQIFVRRP